MSPAVAHQAAIHVLARLLAGLPVERVEMDTLADPYWRGIGQRLTRANGEGRLAALDDALAGHPDAAAIRAAIFADDPTRTLPDWASATTMPPLPAAARPEAPARATPWLAAYVEHAQHISPMTPTLFHQSAGLWLVSLVVARRLRLAMPFGEVHPNLYIAWLAPTTLFRKTTGLNIPRSLAHRLFPHLLAAQDTTPEAFLSDLAGRDPGNLDGMTEVEKAEWQAGRHFAAQRGWTLDELSGLLASAGKDYNQGLLEGLLRFYDCEERFTRSTRAQGRITVRNAYVSLLGASTPAAMAPYLNDPRLWDNGWWPRFALLTPEAERPAWQTADPQPEPPELSAALVRLYRRLPEAKWPDPPTALSVQLGAGVFDQWQAYAKAMAYDLLTDDLDTRLWGAYGRLPTHALKVATLLAALDWPADAGAPTIGPGHMTQALTVVEGWRASVHRAVLTTVNAAENPLHRRILKLVSKAEPQGLTVRDVRNNIRDKSQATLEAAMQELVELGNLEEMPVEKRGAGRPTKRYRLAREDAA